MSSEDKKASLAVESVLAPLLVAFAFLPLKSCLCEGFQPDYTVLQPALLLHPPFCWVTYACAWRSWLNKCSWDSDACWVLALKLWHRASKASSEVLLDFLAAAAALFPAVSVPSLCCSFILR